LNQRADLSHGDFVSLRLGFRGSLDLGHFIGDSSCLRVHQSLCIVDHLGFKVDAGVRRRLDDGRQLCLGDEVSLGLLLCLGGSVSLGVSLGVNIDGGLGLRRSERVLLSFSLVNNLSGDIDACGRIYLGGGQDLSLGLDVSLNLGLSLIHGNSRGDGLCLSLGDSLIDGLSVTAALTSIIVVLLRVAPLAFILVLPPRFRLACLTLVLLVSVTAVEALVTTSHEGRGWHLLVVRGHTVLGRGRCILRSRGLRAST